MGHFCQCCKTFFCPLHFFSEPNICKSFNLSKGSWDFVTECSPHYLKDEGLSLAAASGTETEKMDELVYSLEASLSSKSSS